MNRHSLVFLRLSFYLYRWHSDRWSSGHFCFLAVNVLVALAALGSCGTMRVQSQIISVRPQDGTMDQRLTIIISGLQPQQPAIVRASMQDAEGRLWQSFGGFYANDRGVIDLSEREPVNGTYRGVDPMGLIKSMNVPGSNYDRTRLTPNRADPLKVKFSVEVNGQELASSEIIRRFKLDDRKIIDVRQDGVVGTLFTPPGKGPFPGVIVLGGSDGGLNSEDLAALLSSHGYASMALAYFGAEGLPQSLEEIPVEYFKRAIDWMGQQEFIRQGGLAFLGTSKGSEAALLVGTHYKEVRAVIGYVPSGVVWSCICTTPNRSSWSFGGKSVPFIPQGTDPTYKVPSGFPIRPTINYKYRLKNLEHVNRATIPVERINGPVMLISGGDDQIWPSSVLAGLIMQRLKKYKHPFANQHLVYESAGHLVGKAYLPAGSTLIAGGRLETGGTPEGNSAAQEDSWPRVLKFLETAFHVNAYKRRARNAAGLRRHETHRARGAAAYPAVRRGFS